MGKPKKVAVEPKSNAAEPLKKTGDSHPKKPVVVSADISEKEPVPEATERPEGNVSEPAVAEPIEKAVAEQDISPAAVPPKTTVEKLSELFAILDIKKAYYVDDYNNIDYFPTVAAYTKTMFLEDQKDKLTVVYGEQLNLNVPDEEVLGEALNKLWEDIEPESQKKIVAKIHEVQEIEFNLKDFERTRELQNHFPQGSLTCISPDAWNDLLNNLSANPDEKVLILFDQDLSNAQEDRFKNGTIKGQHLILEVKALDFKDNVYCALITHIITSTSDELAERDKIIDDSGKKLAKNDFLALTKERIANPELLCDGIKKTLLNGYFEVIKEKSMAIMEKARDNTNKAFEKLDTYDFDTTILRSSYSEGVWEANTIFRITDNIYEDEVKKLMVKTNYAKEINPILKISKKLSDVKFTIDPGTSPYKEKYKLRHHDIYTLGAQLNPLHSPIENGDIFQVTEGTGQGHYVLIGQECDLMMRTKPLGSRSSNIVGTLAKIKVMTAEALEEAIRKGPNHFYASKFKLEYFNIGTTDVGLISFLDTFSVNLDVLDLCVYQTDGKAALDLSKKFDIDLVSTAWEERCQKLVKSYTKQSTTLDILIGELEKVTKAQGKQIKIKLFPKLCFTENLGKINCYESKKFDFGIKRVMHLKPMGANYLLERYYTHLSRTAEPHDFALAI